MTILLMLQLLLGNFVQKWYFPQGVSGFGNTVMQITDTDRDGYFEFVFTTYGSWPPYLHFYELHLPDTWQIDSTPLIGGDLLWASGDFDNDGCCDLALQFHIETPSLADGIMIYESPDSFSYPTQEVWRDTVGFALVQPISTYDVDRDGYAEIFKLGWNSGVYYPFGIYESTGNNQYDTIFMGTGLGSLSSTIAFGDFDTDSCNEFVVGNINGWYQIWECSTDNNYQLVDQQQLPTGNIKDCFAIPDADGDGKMEFVVKGFVIPTAEIHAFIFEATGDNMYETIKTFTLPGGDYYGGYSDVGDVDGDGIPEIALEGRQTVHIIKAAGNDSFYVWATLPGNSSGSCVRVFDLDGNGLSEIIISGNNQTRIYEYQVGIEETTAYEIQKVTLTVFPNPFSKLTTVSFSIEQSAKSIEMKIYDASGRLVKDWYYAMPHAPCAMQISWDGTDQANRQLPCGVYFVELVTSNHKITSKIIKLE
jgi:hypothetical protein